MTPWTTGITMLMTRPPETQATIYAMHNGSAQRNVDKGKKTEAMFLAELEEPRSIAELCDIFNMSKSGVQNCVKRMVESELIRLVETGPNRWQV